MLFFCCLKKELATSVMKKSTKPNSFDRRKCQSGLDGVNAEYVLEFADMKQLYLPPEELKNEAGNTIAKMECVGGKLKAYINVVHCIRPDNVSPLGIAEAIKAELIRERVFEFIQGYVQKHLKCQAIDECLYHMKVRAMECNLTLPCVGGAKPSDVIALLDLSLDKTVLFRKQKEKAKCGKVNTGCLYSKPKEYKLKVYDKTEEQHSNGNPLVEKNLLRIEVVFIDRSLRRMYGEKRTLMDVLTVRGIEIMCREYKRVLEEDIINESIKPCLDECMELLLDSLMSSETGNEVAETIARHKNLIPDIEVLRRALKCWYERRERKDNSRQVICHYRRKNMGLPEGVLKTLRAFHTAAG